MRRRSCLFLALLAAGSLVVASCGKKETPVKKPGPEKQDIELPLKVAHV